jgi:hypothetical protein
MHLKTNSISRLLASGFLFVFSLTLYGQNILSDLDHDEREIYDRMVILCGGDPLFHTSIFPYLRGDLVILADTFVKYAETPIDAYQVQSIWDENNEFVKPKNLHPDSMKVYSDSSHTFSSLDYNNTDARYRLSQHPLWHTFYKTPAHFFEVDVEDFYLRLDPVVNVSLGRESVEGVTTFTNQRGFTMRGGVGRNIFFQTGLYDSQIRYVNYVNQFTDENGVVPGVGLYKEYKSSIFDFAQGRDFLLATAYVGVNLGKYVGFQLGHGQHFIGDGIRSLFLSDFSTPYFSLKFNTRIWKFHYQNIFAELAADDFHSVNGADEVVPKKYMAAHYLSFKPGRNISVGLFEAVIFDRPGHHFELQYLNPVILYRTIEGSIGSPDNVILGFSARGNIKKTISVYGQFILDDIQLGEIIHGHLDWWGNKFGHQLGVKYINAFSIPYLDAQIEWNKVRPYTYSHYNSDANYANYKQALAHPLGANFNEWIASLRYQISPKLVAESRIFFIHKGEDADSVSYGGNLNIPNSQRASDYGNNVGQGVRADITYWSTGLHYEWKEGLFLDLQYLSRTKRSALPERNLDTKFIQFGLRLNIARRENVF